MRSSKREEIYVYLKVITSPYHCTMQNHGHRQKQTTLRLTAPEIFRNEEKPENGYQKTKKYIEFKD
jgi:hypothetical protein